MEANLKIMFSLLPKNRKSIDDIKTKSDKLAEWKPVIKKPTPIEDEDKLGEDEKEPVFTSTK